MKKTTSIGVRQTINYVLFGVMVLLPLSSVAQQSLIFTEANPEYRNALDLYEKEKYVPAQEYFEKTIESINDVHSEIRIEAEYYYAVCAIELFHANAETLLRKFIESHPESPHILPAYLNLAKFQFRKKKYEDVLEYLAKIDPLDLSADERDEFYFKKGYSHFQLDEFDEAAKNFYEIKDTDNLYVSAARYYYAHISYKEGKYQTASENFKRIENDPKFGAIVPYYLTQIYYLQGKYDKLLAYAPAVLDSAPPKKEDEIRKLIGDAYYKTGEYEKALPYLELYTKKNRVTPDEYYQLGYTYFQTRNYEQAVNSLQKAIGENDTISQSAYYLIGQSNFNGNNKKAARAALRNAWKLNIDEEITEDALFNYAKLAYELSYHPYDDAIIAFEEYINSYPNSVKLNDAYEYLVGVYYTTKNYQKALESIDRIKRQDIKLLQAKQRLAYYRGIELFQKGDFIDAVDLFEISLKNNYDPKLKASALFWMAEGFFKLGDYDNAENFYSDFLSSSFATSLDIYEKGFYNVAYSHYERRDYQSAIFWFQEYLDQADAKNVGLISDANLRIGDSYFIQRNYFKAIEYYDEAANTSLNNEDYAILQSSISYGVLGDYKKKSRKLKSLVNDNPSSVYVDDALFELGKTEDLLGNTEEALTYYNKLVTDYPNSNYLAEAYLKIGLIHYNKKEDDLALNSFDKVVKKFSGSKAARGALDKIQKIYIDKGDAEAYQDYINGVPFANISKRQLDSTAYVIAENAYLEGKCDKAVIDFSNYLSRYPKGLYVLNSHYYKADCQAKVEKGVKAIDDYKFVLAQSTNKFTEKSLVSLGRIYRDNNQKEAAIDIYKRLRVSASRKENKRLADINLMKIYFGAKDYNNASVYAEKVLSEEVPDVELWQEAKLTLSKTSFEKANYKEAIIHLDTLSKAKNEIGAEAKYLLAKTYHLQGIYDQSDTLIDALVDQVPSYPYWIAKGFILLADNFIQREDAYNARLTYQSVIDNADDEELIQIAKNKLQELTDAENEQNKEEIEEVEIDFTPPEGNNNQLFEPDSVGNPLNKKEVKDEK